ncbi:MAG: hypothetical protein ACRDVW_10440 [Acidimicrobiales bacterium]
MNRALGLALVAAGAAFAWWEGGLHQYSTAGHAGVLAAIALAFVALVVAGVGRQPATSAEWVRGPTAIARHYHEDPARTIAVAIWVALILASIGWDLNSFAHQSHDLPTLSSIIGHLTSTRGGRATVVALWLVLGAALAVGWRRRR